MRSLVRAEARGEHRWKKGRGLQPAPSRAALSPSFQPLGLGPLPHPGEDAAILSKPMLEAHHSKPRFDPLEALASQTPMRDASGPLGVSGWWLASPGPHPVNGSGTWPSAHIQCQIRHNTTVSNALKIYFLGRLFFKHYGVHWKSSGKMHLKHFFLRKKKISIFIMFSFFFSKQPVDKGKPTD